jgi:hypothetical protein
VVFEVDLPDSPCIETIIIAFVLSVIFFLISLMLMPYEDLAKSTNTIDNAHQQNRSRSIKMIHLNYNG